jgi:hypothetical protein
MVRPVFAIVMISVLLCLSGCAPPYHTRMEELDSETWYETPELGMPQPDAALTEPEGSPVDSLEVPRGLAQPDSAGTQGNTPGAEAED